MDIKVDGIRLDAELEMPEGHEGTCPLAIVVHGLTGYKEETHILAAAAALRECGMATLRVDMYGHGKSDGDFAEHTLYKWITCLLAVVDYAKTLDFVSDIYLCGHSQGGLTIILAAGMLKGRIAGIIPMSPAIVIIDGARTGNFLGAFDFDPNDIPDRIGAEPRVINGNYFRIAQTIDANAAIDAYQGPVLLIHGDEDQAVPVSYSLDAAKRYTNAELVVIEGADHNYTKDGQLDQVCEAIKDWTRRQLA